MMKCLYGFVFNLQRVNTYTLLLFNFSTLKPKTLK